MANGKVCPECDGTNLFVRRDVGVKGPYGPNLLPGAGGFFFGPRVTVVVCKDCGYVRHFAEAETRAKIGSDSGWDRL
jgi:predicted nucleic-acid-binding Zn-ribbon protein